MSLQSDGKTRPSTPRGQSNKPHYERAVISEFTRPPPRLRAPFVFIRSNATVNYRRRRSFIFASAIDYSFPPYALPYTLGSSDYLSVLIRLSSIPVIPPEGCTLFACLPLLSRTSRRFVPAVVTIESAEFVYQPRRN